MEETVRALVACHNRNTWSESETGDRGIGAARRHLKALLDSSAADSRGRLVLEEDWFELPPLPPRREHPAPPCGGPRRAANVLATLRGSTDPDRVYVVGGHYDSRASGRYDVHAFAPGANDDAGGTAVVVELARVLASLEPEATIVFACYAGEEQGLLGSTHHARALEAAGTRVAGMITNDIVGNTLGDNGRRDDRTLRIFSRSGPDADSPSREWARYAAGCIRAHVDSLHPRLVFRLDRLGRGGDHRPFDERGWPAIRFTEPNEAYTRQHQDVRTEGGIRYGDVIEGVDFAYLEKVARANLATVLSAALAPDPPAEVRLHRQKEIHARLTWRPARARDVAGYEVVWRDTTAPDWQHARAAGEGTEAVIEEGVDDLLFGVRAVDRDGFRSPVVPAAPAPRKRSNQRRLRRVRPPRSHRGRCHTED